MVDSQNENIYWRFIKFLISISLSIALLELSGVDVTKANIVSFDKFSLPTLILLSLCLHTFDNMLKTIVKWLEKK